MKTNTIKRIAIYTRTAASSDAYIAQQRSQSEAFIEQQQGWQIVPTNYDDNGFSGMKMNRPAFQRLLADIEQGLIDCVVVSDVGRLIRPKNIEEHYDVLNMFQKYGVEFVSCNC